MSRPLASSGILRSLVTCCAVVCQVHAGRGRSPSTSSLAAGGREGGAGAWRIWVASVSARCPLPRGGGEGTEVRADGGYTREAGGLHEGGGKSTLPQHSHR